MHIVQLRTAQHAIRQHNIGSNNTNNIFICYVYGCMCVFDDNADDAIIIFCHAAHAPSSLRARTFGRRHASKDHPALTGFWYRCNKGDQLTL